MATPLQWTPEVLTRITAPKHRKGATEEHIFADNQRAKTTAKLMAELAPSHAALARTASPIQGEGTK